MCSGRGDTPQRVPGFPIRKPPDHSLAADSPGLIAGSNVLLRLLVPRHSPCALINLATTDDARVHCAVLKIRAVPALHRRAGDYVDTILRGTKSADIPIEQPTRFDLIINLPHDTRDSPGSRRASN